MSLPAAHPGPAAGSSQGEIVSTHLSQELAVYERRLPALLRDHDGEYVVIKGEELRHFSADYEEALTWAYEHLGLSGFFVKRVTPDAGTLHLTRDVGLCR
jgi:hypothetical protein